VFYDFVKCFKFLEILLNYVYINIDVKEIVLKIVQYTIKSILLITLFSLAIACVIPTPGDISSGFIETDDPAWFKFFSNDPLDYGRAFTYLVDGSSQDSFISAETIVKKNSGYIYSDYGMIFCAENDSWLALVIDTQQNYRVIKSVNGVVTQLINWTYSGELAPGYSVLNILKVEQSSAENFDIYLNTALTDSFNEPGLVSGSSGYFVYVASENYENLDENPVEVLYADL